jgi:hypothetical protein
MREETFRACRVIVHNARLASCDWRPVPSAGAGQEAEGETGDSAGRRISCIYKLRMKKT